MEKDIFERFHQTGVIPVLEIEEAENAVPLAEALLAGGLSIAEITLRTDAALASIRKMAGAVPEVLTGAGTVLTAGQAQAAHEAGAQFLVCPGMVDDVVIWGQEHGVPVLAGAATPTEMIHGLNLGLKVLKFFPAEALGGIKTLQAASDPFPHLRFIPTGGIRLNHVAEYLQAERIHAVGGSWMAKREMVREGRFDEITRLAAEATQAVKQVRG